LAVADALTKEEQDLLDLLRAYIKSQYDTASNEFRKKPEGENWDRLETMMWAYQAVSRGGLPDRMLLVILETKPIIHWIDALHKQHKGTD
jgi:hypothetical protein